LERQQTRFAERKRKLAAAQQQRYQENLKRRQQELSVKEQLVGLPPGFFALADPVPPVTGSGGVFQATG
jgi:hypothetical protein